MPGDPGDDLTDDTLQEEIELVGDLVVAATSSEGPLSQRQIDEVLGVGVGLESGAEVGVEPEQHENGAGSPTPTR